MGVNNLTNSELKQIKGGGTGTIKWYNQENGLGMITPDGGAQDISFIQRANPEDGFRLLETGQRVQFQLKQGQNGPKAVNVHII